MEAFYKTTKPTQKRVTKGTTDESTKSYKEQEMSKSEMLSRKKEGSGLWCKRTPAWDG